MNQRHDYRVEGVVNGRPVLGVGEGVIDTTTGVSEINVEFTHLAEGWDPRTIVLMCCDRALVMAARETPGTVGMYRASGGYLSIGRHLIGNNRETYARAADGRVLAHVRASSVTDFRTDPAIDHSRIEGGVSHLRFGVNGIAHVPAFDGIMMQAGPGLIVVTTRFTALLEDGTSLYGSTTYPHYLPEQSVEVPYYQILRVESVEQEFDGRLLWSRVTTSVLPLAPPIADQEHAAIERLASMA